MGFPTCFVNLGTFVVLLQQRFAFAYEDIIDKNIPVEDENQQGKLEVKPGTRGKWHTAYILKPTPTDNIRFHIETLINWPFEPPYLANNFVDNVYICSVHTVEMKL